MHPSPFATVDMAPRDPILGVTEAYNADPNPNKVNLGVGVYTNDEGKVPVLDCVRRAEQRLVESVIHNYLPIDGLKSHDNAVQQVVFGRDNAPAQRPDRHGAGGRWHRRLQGGVRSAAAGESVRRRLDQRSPAGRIMARFWNTPVTASTDIPTMTLKTHGVKFDAMLSPRS